MTKQFLTSILLLAATAGSAQVSPGQAIHIIDSLAKKTVGVACGEGYRKNTFAQFTGDTYTRTETLYSGADKKTEETNEFNFTDINWTTMMKMEVDKDEYCKGSNLRVLNISFRKPVKRSFNNMEDKYPTIQLVLAAGDLPLAQKTLKQLSEAKK